MIWLSGLFWANCQRENHTLDTDMVVLSFEMLNNFQLINFYLKLNSCHKAHPDSYHSLATYSPHLQPQYVLNCWFSGFALGREILNCISQIKIAILCHLPVWEVSWPDLHRLLFMRGLWVCLLQEWHHGTLGMASLGCSEEMLLLTVWCESETLSYIRTAMDCHHFTDSLL